MPISYSPRNGQHHHNLWTYKARPPVPQARWNLLALLLLFLRGHLGCVTTRLGGAVTQAVVVPSTKGNPGPHPLRTLVGDRLGLPWVDVTVNPRYGAGERRFHADWFSVDRSALPPSAQVIILDDTWTTGARAQSLAHALKLAGASSVGIVVLGRHVKPEHEASARLLSAITSQVFDVGTCVVHDNAA